MEVRVCPSCGTENKKSRTTCVNCYTSLASVPATQSGAGAQGTPPQGKTLSGAPMPGGQTQPSGSPVGTQPRPQAPPPGVPPTRVGTGAQQPYSSSEPASGGSMAWIFIVVGVLLVIGVVAFVGMQIRPFAQRAAVLPKVSSDKVVTSFLEAKKTHDYAKVKPLLSEESVKMIDAAFSGRQVQSAGFGSEDSYKMYLWEVSPTPRQLNMSEYRTKPMANTEAAENGFRVVRVSLTPLQSAKESQDMSDQMELSSMPSEVDFYLVIENAEWKIDVKETMKHAEDKPLVMPK